MQPGEALFLKLKVTNCSGERSFSRFKIIKNELKGRSVSGEVVHTKHSIHQKRKTQTNNEFVGNFVMKKAGQNLFSCLLCYVQLYLIR